MLYIGAYALGMGSYGQGMEVYIGAYPLGLGPYIGPYPQGIGPYTGPYALGICPCQALSIPPSHNQIGTHIGPYTLGNVARATFTIAIGVSPQKETFSSAGH